MPKGHRPATFIKPSRGKKGQKMRNPIQSNPIRLHFYFDIVKVLLAI